MWQGSGGHPRGGSRVLGVPGNHVAGMRESEAQRMSAPVQGGEQVGRKPASLSRDEMEHKARAPACGVLHRGGPSLREGLTDRKHPKASVKTQYGTESRAERKGSSESVLLHTCTSPRCLLLRERPPPPPPRRGASEGADRLSRS